MRARAWHSQNDIYAIYSNRRSALFFIRSTEFVFWRQCFAIIRAYQRYGNMCFVAACCIQFGNINYAAVDGIIHRRCHRRFLSIKRKGNRICFALVHTVQRQHPFKRSYSRVCDECSRQSSYLVAQLTNMHSNRCILC